MKKFTILLILVTIFFNAVKSQTTGTVIGKTTFDNQSNGSPRNGIQITPAGQIAVVYTGSTELNRVFSDRGSFYNFYNGTSWGINPTSRLEGLRTGWPCVVYTQTGKEVVISHDAATAKLIINTRNTIGTGSWNTNATMLNGMWPRAVCSNGDTIHLICVSSSTALGNKLLSYRSNDAGLTWTSAIEIANSTNGVALLNGDNYSIDAKGRTIAVVVGGVNNSLVLIKSTNNSLIGAPRKTIFSFPYSNFAGNQVIPITNTTDGISSVVIGKGDTVHVLVGTAYISDDNASDNSWVNYYADGLQYWNDGRIQNDLTAIATIPDINKDGAISANPYGSYGTSTKTSFGSIAYDSINRRIYAVYSTPIENSVKSPSNYDFKEIYVSTSTNYGLTWSEGVRISNFGSSIAGQNENMFPIAWKHVTNKLHLVWQQMKRPGINVDQSVALDTASIMYASFTPSDLQTTFTDSISPNTANIICKGVNNVFNTYYHAIGSFNLGNTFKVELSDAQGSFANPIILGQVSSVNTFGVIPATISNNVSSAMQNNSNYKVRIVSSNPVTNSGSNLIIIPRGHDQITLVGLDDNNITKNFGICTGETMQLGINGSSQITTANWYLNGANLIQTNNNILSNINAGGTYKVIVNNGCFNDSNQVIIPANTKPNASFTSSLTGAGCEGSNPTLIASVQPNVTYEWYNNAKLNETASFMTAANAGLYYLKVYSNPGCFTTSSTQFVNLSSGSNYNVTKQATGLNVSSKAVFIKTIDVNNAWAMMFNNSNDTIPLSKPVTKTSDGGNTWLPVTVTGATNLVPNNITSVNAQTAWVIMHNFRLGGSKVFKTTDGGTNWFQQASSTASSFYNNIHFFNSNDGVIMGDQINGCFEILTTNDGGSNWLPVNCNNISTSSTGNGTILKFAFFGNSIWFLSTDGHVIYSSNKGANWIGYKTPLPSISKIVFKNLTEGIISGYNSNGSFQIYSTNDAGATWTLIEHKGLVMNYDLAYSPDGSLLLSSGFSNNIQNLKGITFSKDNGVNWSYMGSVDTAGQQFLGISFIANRKAYIGGFNQNSSNGGVHLLSIDEATISSSNGSQFCQGDSSVLSSIIVPGYNLQWQLNGNDILNQTTTSTIIKSGGLVSLKISKTSGCPFNSNTISLTQNPKPAVRSLTTSGNVTFCNGKSVTLSVPAGLKYKWTKNGVDLTDTLNSLSVNSSGKYNVRVTNSNNCSSLMQDTTVTIIPLPITSSILGSIAVKTATDETYSVTNTSGSSYNWIITGGVQKSGSSTNSISVTWGAAGVGEVKVIETNSAGCIGNALSLSVTISKINVINKDWKLIANDGAGDGRNPILMDGKRLDYFYDNITDSLFFKVTTFGINSNQADSVGVNIMVNIPGSGLPAPFHFWDGTNEEMAATYHRGLTTWVTGTPLSNYSGVIGVFDTIGISLNNYNNLSANNISIAVNRSDSTIILGLKRVSLIPDANFTGNSLTLKVMGAVGSNYSWNDNIYSANAIITLTKPLVSVNSVENIKNNILVYPNPSNGKLTLENKSNFKADIKIFDISGMLINSFTNEANSKQLLDYNYLKDGLYIINVTNETGVQNIKIVISK